MENLNTLIASQPAAPAAAAGEPAAQPDAGPRKIDGPEAKPIDLLDAAGAPILKRALPVVVVVAALIVWLVVK